MFYITYWVYGSALNRVAAVPAQDRNQAVYQFELALRNGERLVMDREWDRLRRCHRYTVLIAKGAMIVAWMSTDTDRPTANAEYDRVAEKWRAMQ